MWTHGHFYWNELMTRDVAAAKAFYGETLGWQFSDMPMAQGGTYTLCNVGEVNVGGLFDMGQGDEFAGIPDHWFTYIAVDDVDKRVATALNMGASLKRPLIDVPEVGRIAIVQDTVGAAVGWMTPA